MTEVKGLGIAEEEFTCSCGDDVAAAAVWWISTGDAQEGVGGLLLNW